jgi:hypothetical protein
MDGRLEPGNYKLRAFPRAHGMTGRAATMPSASSGSPYPVRATAHALREGPSVSVGQAHALGARARSLNRVGLLGSVEVDPDVLLLHALLDLGGAGERALVGVEQGA